MQYKQPGVYVVEPNAFPQSVVEVPTAVPAFIGYTETAQDAGESRRGVPTRIDSLADYQRIFGGAHKAAFTLARTTDNAGYVVTQDPASRFFLYCAIALYFANGGGPAYVVSIGGYADALANGKRVTDFLPDAEADSPLDALKKVLDVTLLVAPDTVLLDSAQSCYRFWTEALAHCGYMQSRMALIDIFDGDKPRMLAPDTDVISGSETGLRALIGSNSLSYGAAYYPWINFEVVDSKEITFANLDGSSLAVLRDALNEELTTLQPQPDTPELTKLQALYSGLVAQDSKSGDDAATAATTDVTRIHSELLAASPLYRRITSDMLARVNVLPPCGAMAGVYARFDSTQGVFKAPANTSINLAVSPAVDISAADQADLNEPQDGRAVNAIRTFSGRGLVIWGARTLDANSADWRYINVRRTMIMLEQSIKASTLPYVFAPNDANTWTTVQSMISDFLAYQWRRGALAGATQQDAYSVSVGLGSTMTAEDVLESTMRVDVAVAVTRPGEFIELTFQQTMQAH